MSFQYSSATALRRFSSSTSFRHSSSYSNTIKSFNLAISYTEKILRDKVNIIKSLSNEEYVKKWPQFFGASIGQHVRHSCDHFKQVDGCISLHIMCHFIHSLYYLHIYSIFIDIA